MVCFQKAQDLGDPNAARYVEQCRSLIQAGTLDPEPAVKSTNDAQELFAEAANLAASGRHAEAVSCYEDGLGLDPGNVAAWFNMGHSIGLLGRHRNVVRCCDRALKIHPNFSALWILKGLAFLSMDQFDDAMACFEKAKELGDTSAADRIVQCRMAQAEWYFRLGSRYQQEGNHTEANACHQKGLARNPSNGVIWVNRGAALLALNRSNEAVACFDRAIALNPNDSSAWNNKGIALMSLGRGGRLSFESVEDAERRARLVIPNELHPWPPLLAFVLNLDSTEVVSLIDRTGLAVEWALSGNDDYSNKTRKRAYRPRLDAAFRALDDSGQLRVAWILTRELLQRHPEQEEPLRSKLAEIGWRIDAGTLVPSSSPIRELLFMQGTEYDSYRAIKRVLQEAKQCVAVVDPYLDGTIFTMLSTSTSPALSVRLLTAKVPPDFALEGEKFRKQFPQFTIDARKTFDFHDRFIIVDDSRCWHVGASIKDAGGKTFMISELEDATKRDALKQSFVSSWNTGQAISIPCSG